MRRRTVVLAVLVAAGFLAPVAATLAGRSALAFRVSAARPTNELALAPGKTVCQGPVPVLSRFAAVRLPGDGQPVRVSVRGTAAETRSAAGRLGEPIAVGTVPRGGSVEVCVRNDGDSTLSMAGSAATAVPGSAARTDGRVTATDVRIDFVRQAPTALAARLGEATERLVLFKPGWFGAWTLALLAAAIVVGVPLALFAAVRSAAGGERAG